MKLLVTMMVGLLETILLLELFCAGVKGNLKACMRWGVGTNNVDFAAFKQFNIPIENTPEYLDVKLLT